MGFVFFGRNGGSLKSSSYLGTSFRSNCRLNVEHSLDEVFLAYTLSSFIKSIEDGPSHVHPCFRDISALEPIIDSLLIHLLEESL